MQKMFWRLRATVDAGGETGEVHVVPAEGDKLGSSAIVRVIAQVDGMSS